MNRKYRKTVIAGNWKMNKLPSEAKPFVEELRAAMPKTKTCESVLCVPYPIIPAMAKVMRDSRLAFGAQDVSAHESGASTRPCWPTWASSTASSATASAASITPRAIPS